MFQRSSVTTIFLLGSCPEMEATVDLHRGCAPASEEEKVCLEAERMFLEAAAMSGNRFLLLERVILEDTSN